MFCIVSAVRLKDRYPAEASALLGALHDLGTVVDVSGLLRTDIQRRIATLPAGPVCLIGGADLMFPFWRVNPTFQMTGDPDPWIATDAPYGAEPGEAFAYEEFAPSRAVSRLPEPVAGDGASFLSLLQRQAQAPLTPTPPGSFEMAAAEFGGAQTQVRDVMDPIAQPGLVSPPVDQDRQGLLALISGRGRMHVALHGVRSAPGWGTLLGREAQGTVEVPALTAAQLASCQLRGMVATFSACYAGMLDRGEDAADSVPARDASNQVALACLSAGAKAVFASSRANWIDIQPPFDSFGPALTVHVWQQLAAGHGAAEALRLAKRSYIRSALEGSRESLPFVQKTVLQAHCYGHPGATL